MTKMLPRPALRQPPRQQPLQVRILPLREPQRHRVLLLLLRLPVLLRRLRPQPRKPPSATPAATDTAAAPAPDKNEPLPYSAAWHHRHLYAPRSVSVDSIMPSYRFLYEKRRISGERAADALQLSGPDAPPEGWEIVPSYDAKCLVAYLMSLDQSHALAEVKSTAPASPPAPGKAAK